MNKDLPPREPSGAAIDQDSKGWGTQCIVGSFESKLLPLFLLAQITIDAHGDVLPSALPMSIELAYVIDGLREEWEAFASVVRDFA